MPEYVGGALSAGAGSTTLPLFSIYGSATKPIVVRELDLYNTTDTSFAVVLKRLTTTGTQGATLTEAEMDPYDTDTPIGQLFQTHSVAPTLGDDLGYRAQIAAAKGAGKEWVFSGRGLIIPATANAGVGCLIENGTGQVVQWRMKWED